MPKTERPSYYLGLDVGTRRIGVSMADDMVQIAFPVDTLEMDETVAERISVLADEKKCETIVVGYPRNQSGDPTAQTAYVEDFIEQLRLVTTKKIVYQDESLTSVLAEERLKARKKNYSRADIDAEAACIILTDYLEARHA